jgi:Prokaryotic E2 family E
MLRPADRETLKRLGLPFKVSWQHGFTMVQIQDYPVGPGLVPDKVTILLRLPTGFPDVHPDMFWVDPPVRLASGGAIRGTEYMETHLDRQWQRWSRHVIGNWRPGMDNLSTYLAYIRRCFDQEKGRR